MLYSNPKKPWQGSFEAKNDEEATLKQIAPDIDMLIMAPDGTPILLPSPTS